LVEGEIQHLKPSKNSYDWLGDGIYFFEEDLLRAKRFAEVAATFPHKRYTAKPITAPYVVGAVIRLGACLDLSKQAGIEEFRSAYNLLVKSMGDGYEMPANKAAGPDDREGILRHLDRAVLNFIHGQRIIENKPPYDTVRGFFHQGGSVVPTSAVGQLSHVQIAVRNTACILGYFHPCEPLDDPFQGLLCIPAKPYRRKKVHE
jgi:hypothetical protein